MDGALAVIDEALTTCLAVPLWARSPEEVVRFLDRVQELEQRLSGLKLHLVREVDSLDVPRKHGAPNIVSWLRDRHRISGGSAKRIVYHHRVIHEGEWQVELHNNLPRFIPPDYIGPDRKPLRNTYHRRP